MRDLVAAFLLGPLRVPSTAGHRVVGLPLVTVLLVLILDAPSFLAKGFRFKLMPVAFDMLQSVNEVSKYFKNRDVGSVLNRWLGGWFFRREIRMLEDVLGTGSLGGIVSEYGGDEIHRTR